MNLNELIEEAEDCRNLGLESNALTLLPLLVSIIKNQQRQIDTLKPLIKEVHDLDSGEQDCIAKDCGTALRTIRAIAAELEDIK